MATRSTIAMRYPDGHVKAVYCHWDGYPSHNGKILLEHYSNPWLLNELLSLGAISVLLPKIGRKHPFDYQFMPETTSEQIARWETWSLFYHRDRGEELRIMKFPSVEAYLKDPPREEFNYLYAAALDEWLVGRGESGMRSLRGELRIAA